MAAPLVFDMLKDFLFDRVLRFQRTPGLYIFKTCAGTFELGFLTGEILPAEHGYVTVLGIDVDGEAASLRDLAGDQRCTAPQERIVDVRTGFGVIEDWAAHNLDWLLGPVAVAAVFAGLNVPYRVLAAVAGPLRGALGRIPARLVLPVVVTAAKCEAVLYPNDLAANGEAGGLDALRDIPGVQRSVPDIDDGAGKKPPRLGPIRTAVVLYRPELSFCYGLHRRRPARLDRNPHRKAGLSPSGMVWRPHERSLPHPLLCCRRTTPGAGRTARHLPALIPLPPGAVARHRPARLALAVVRPAPADQNPLGSDRGRVPSAQPAPGREYPNPNRSPGVIDYPSAGTRGFAPA